MTVGRLWLGPVLLVLLFALDIRLVRGDGGAPVQCPTCEKTGTCVQADCQESGGRYLATDVVVLDNAHGRRLWQRGFGPKGNAASADAYCAALVLHGIGGWRVPTNPEIGTIVLRPLGLGSRPDACFPAIDQAAFAYPDPAGTQYFWTSSVQGPQPIRYIRDFSNGRSPRTFEDDTDVHVRCVHDPIF